MEQVTTAPKTRKPRAKANVKEQEPEPTLEQPKTRKPRTKTTIKEQMPEPTLEQPKVRKPRAKATIKEQMPESTLEQPKAKAKAKAKPKEPKRLILHREKEAKFLEKSKLRQLKDAERIYNNAIKSLQR